MARSLPASLFLVVVGASSLPAQPPLFEVKQAHLLQSLAWSPDGKQLASGWSDGSIRIHDVPSGKETIKLSIQGPVIGVVFTADAKKIGVKSGAKDGPLSVWDLAKQKQLHQLGFQGYTCNALAFTVDGQTLVAAGPGEHMVWNFGKGGGYGSKQGQVPAGSSAAVSWNGGIAAWTNPAGHVQFFNTDQRKFDRMKIGPVVALAFAPDNTMLAAASPDKSIRLWAVQGSEMKKFEGLRGQAQYLHFSANGKVLAAAGVDDPVIRMWEVASGRLRRRLTVQAAPTSALALSPDGLHLAIGNSHGLFVWSVATRELGDLGEPKALTLAEMKSAWDGLADKDHEKAEGAFRQLATAQHHAHDFLKDQVRAVAVPSIDWSRVQQFLKDLDDPMFPIRQRASRELARLGEPVQKKLEKYIATKPSFEGERRAKKLLELLEFPELTADRLRCLEVIEILEIWHSAQAQSLLQEIARDSLLAQIRVAASEAQQRLQRAKGVKK